MQQDPQAAPFFQPQMAPGPWDPQVASYYAQPPIPSPFGEVQAQLPLGYPPAPPAFGQPQAPVYGQPTQQAAPVMPVSCPTYTPAANAGAQTTPQQAASRQMIQIARTLEQSIPGYQIMVSVLEGLRESPRAAGLTGLEPLLLTVSEIIYHQYAALGAIRRFLCGEATAAIATSLAKQVRKLSQLHTQLRPQFERVSMAAAPELRGAIMGLSQILGTGDSLLGQTATAVQTFTGPQIWEAAGTPVLEAAASTAP